ncbi:MAG: tungstate ABC transporter substrate-binding protein WtpA [Candidatus Velthaea sp.]
MKRRAFITIATALAVAPRSANAAGGNVSIAYAGSLVAPMEKSIGPAFAATGYGYKGEGRGSTAIANLIRDGLRTPDVFISADTAAIESLRGPAGHDTAKWYATFASTRIQIAYSAKSKHAADFAAAARGAKPWYEILQIPGAIVARTDPAQDPKGYRVLLVMQLAERFYKQPGLQQKILGEQRNSEQIIPEEDALARLQTGEVDAIWAYSTESVARGLEVIELPPQINLGDPKFAPLYSSVSVTVGAKTYRGGPSIYALTIPTNATNPEGGAAFIEFFLGARGKALLAKAGLQIQTPSIVGDRTAIPPALVALLG